MSFRVTAELDGSKDSFVFGGRYGIGVAKKESSDLRLTQRFWSKEDELEGKHERMRANDGAVDSQGRFWVGIMTDPEIESVKAHGE